MFLASTSDIIRVVTGSGVSTIGVQADWVDNDTGTYTPGRTNTAITTATTTTIVASPAGSTVRNVKTIQITNNHASSSCLITLQHYDGTTSVDIEKLTLYAGEKFGMADDGEWRHLNPFGGEYEYAGRKTGRGKYGITGTVAESYPRNLCTEGSTTGMTSGTMWLVPIMLRAGDVVTNISFFSGTTAAVTPTNWWFALYDGSLKALLAKSADQTSTAWAANTIQTLAMGTAYTIRRTGSYYVAFMMAAATVVTLKQGIARSAVHLHNMPEKFPPTLFATGDASLTTTPPPTIGTVTASTNPSVWAAVT